MVLPLSQGTYLEVVEVLDHPASDKAPFGQAVRARSELGGGWLGWVVSVDGHLRGRGATRPRAVDGNRHRPDGVELRWKQIGVKGLQSDPQLPFFVQWETTGRPPVGNGASGPCTSTPSRSPATRTGSASGSATRSRSPLEDVKVEWVAPHGTPGVVAAQFSTPTGSSASEPGPASRPLGAVPSPNIWHHPQTYEVENRAVDPDGAIEAAMREVADWAGRDVLDVGCGTGFHLPAGRGTPAR